MRTILDLRASPTEIDTLLMTWLDVNLTSCVLSVNLVSALSASSFMCTNGTSGSLHTKHGSLSR